MKTPPQRRKVQNDAQLVRGGHQGAPYESSAASDEDGNITGDDLPHRGRPPKNLGSIKKDMHSPRSSRQSGHSPGKFLSPSKRRKRELQLAAEAGTESNQQNSQKIQAETFVMKLFDRSLDVSKYTEQTALYPICRAWMANQPRNPTIRNYHDKRSPSPVKRKDNGGEVLGKVKRGEIREITEMPAPRGPILPKPPIVKKPPGEEHDAKSRIDLLVFPDMENGEQLNRRKEELLADHSGKWKKAKSDALKAMKERNKRYEINNLIIKELYKP